MFQVLKYFRPFILNNDVWLHLLYNQEAKNNIIVLDNRKICFLKETVILHNISFGQSAARSFQNMCQTGKTQNITKEKLKIRNIFFTFLRNFLRFDV